jgi:hypothetical protein
MRTQPAVSAAIQSSVGRSLRANTPATSRAWLSRSRQLSVTQKGYTLDRSSVPPEGRHPVLAGFRVRSAGLIGTLVAIAAVVGSSKSF